MEVSIDKVVHGDVLEIKRMLEDSTAVVAENVSREVLYHIGNGVALKMVTDGKITGVWCSIDMGEYTSLSYFYVAPSMRKTIWVLELFVTAGRMIDNSKPVMINTKDTTGFERYVEKVGEGLYRFKGLR
jgi:hypothetical protein